MVEKIWSLKDKEIKIQKQKKFTVRFCKKDNMSIKYWENLWLTILYWKDYIMAKEHLVKVV